LGSPSIAYWRLGGLVVVLVGLLFAALRYSGHG
jgi:hypothetical protein